MEWSFGTTSVVMLGAGFSAAATDGRMPLMRNYFDALTPLGYPNLWGFVSDIAREPGQANVEHVLLCLDQVRSSPDRLLDGWAIKWKQNVPLIQSELATYTLARLRGSMNIQPDNWAAGLLADCGPNTTVISMNYDNIAERVLSNRPGMKHGRQGTCPHCKMRRLLEKGCSCAGSEGLVESDWCGAVIKPHGSVSWKRCLNPECCSYECLIADEKCQPFEPCHCPNCCAECGPVMVMPSMSKNLREVPEIHIMWQAARLAISNAESILFFGFSLPTSDELLLQLIRFAVCQNRKLQRVACIDLDPKGVLDRFERCIPEDVRVDAALYPVEPMKRPEWLKTASLVA